MRGWLATWMIAGALLAPAFVLAYVSLGVPSGFVNDFADVLTVEEERVLEAELVAFEEETTHEIAVVAIASLDGDDIESYANALFREWGVGKADKNNGVLFLMALDDRKMRIEVGYGLEGALTDTEAKEIIDMVITPRFKAGQYDAGIEEGVDQIMREARGETVMRAGAQRGSTVGAGIMEFFGLGVIVIVFSIFRLALATVSATMGKSPSWWQGGVLGAGAWVLAWLMFSVALWVLVVFVGVGLIWDFIVSRMWKSYIVSNKKKNRWLFNPTHYNGSGSGGGRGFGGGGGFGGGSSGGGGASGGW